VENVLWFDIISVYFYLFDFAYCVATILYTLFKAHEHLMKKHCSVYDCFTVAKNWPF